jgi:hypothetical protein
MHLTVSPAMVDPVARDGLAALPQLKHLLEVARAELD